MVTLTTFGIKISVENYYQADYSKPNQNKYIHSYRITIENQSDHTVQLLRRHWIITDSTGIVREVDGEGVIGKKPVLEPGSTYQYESWCPLTSALGKMEGTFLMQNESNKAQFRVRVPEFQLIAPFKLN